MGYSHILTTNIYGFWPTKWHTKSVKSPLVCWGNHNFWWLNQNFRCSRRVGNTRRYASRFPTPVKDSRSAPIRMGEAFGLDLNMYFLGGIIPLGPLRKGGALFQVSELLSFAQKNAMVILWVPNRDNPSRIVFVVDQWSVMWSSQCHKATMTGDGLYHPFLVIWFVAVSLPNNENIAGI